MILVLAFGALVAALLPLAVGHPRHLRRAGHHRGHRALHADVGLRAQPDDDDRARRGHRLLAAHRDPVPRGAEPRAPAARGGAHGPSRTAGSAVITSGLTVVVGFAALLLTPLVETRSIGLGGLVVVAVAVLLSTTLLPALLAILGRAIDRPRWLARRLAWYHAPTIWERWARTLSRHPYRALMLGGARRSRSSPRPSSWIRIGLPSRHWWPTRHRGGRGASRRSRAMGASGSSSRSACWSRCRRARRSPTATRLRGLRNLTDSLARRPAGRDGHAAWSTVTPGASLLDYSVLYSDLDPPRAPSIGDFLDAYLSTDRRIALVDVIPADTTSLTTSMDLVRDIRAHRRRSRSAGSRAPRSSSAATRPRRSTSRTTCCDASRCSSPWCSA